MVDKFVYSETMNWTARSNIRLRHTELSETWQMKSSVPQINGFWFIVPATNTYLSQFNLRFLVFLTTARESPVEMYHKSNQDESNEGLSRTDIILRSDK